MLRHCKKVVKCLVDDASNSSVAEYRSEREHIRMTDSTASLESTVFGGESRIAEQLENFEVVAPGIKVSCITRGLLCIFLVCAFSYSHSTSCQFEVP